MISRRFPLVSTAVYLLRCRSCLIDGEVVVCREDGLAIFDHLRRGPRRNEEAMLYGFDLIELNGTDMRTAPIEERKATLAKLLPADLPGSSLQTCRGSRSPSTSKRTG